MNKREKIIPPHGGYQKLKSYKSAEIVYDATVRFCHRFLDRRSRTVDQMVQAARSGKQNIAEGSMASATSKEMELKLVGVARASLEELLLDYQDYLRQNGHSLWDKDHPRAREIRKLAYLIDRGPIRLIRPISKLPQLKLPPTPLFASFTRPITFWISRCGSWKNSFCMRAGFGSGYTMRDREQETNAISIRCKKFNI